MKFISHILAIIVFLVVWNLSTQAQITRLGKNVLELSEFISSDYFLKLNCSDLNLLDSIYMKAMKITGDDYSEAFLSLTFATIPYKVVPIVMPIIKVRIDIPLVSANDSIFVRKNNNLPKNLLYDSPQDSFGDKDKIAHFFGNAFLSYNTRIFDFTKFLGIFVEDFEKEFKVESKVDFRDLEVNYLGVIFGKAIKKNKNLLPSQVFLSYSILLKSVYEFNFSY